MSSQLRAFDQRKQIFSLDFSVVYIEKHNNWILFNQCLPKLINYKLKNPYQNEISCNQNLTDNKWVFDEAPLRMTWCLNSSILDFF